MFFSMKSLQSKLALSQQRLEPSPDSTATATVATPTLRDGRNFNPTQYSPEPHSLTEAPLANSLRYWHTFGSVRSTSHLSDGRSAYKASHARFLAGVAVYPLNVAICNRCCSTSSMPPGLVTASMGSSRRPNDGWISHSASNLSSGHEPHSRLQATAVLDLREPFQAVQQLALGGSESGNALGYGYQISRLSRN